MVQSHDCGLLRTGHTILVDDLEPKREVIDLEERFCSVTLDIIGKAVFDYDFGSVTNESPIVKAVYRVLREAEHRSSSFIPYWDLPYADQWMGGQVEFRKDMTMLDDILCRFDQSRRFDATQTRPWRNWKSATMRTTRRCFDFWWTCAAKTSTAWSCVTI